MKDQTLLCIKSQRIKTHFILTFKLFQSLGANTECPKLRYLALGSAKKSCNSSLKLDRIKKKRDSRKKEMTLLCQAPSTGGSWTSKLICLSNPYKLRRDEGSGGQGL